MAITIITTPADIVSAYNPITITCSSDNTAEVNFKYIFQVFIGGVEKAKIKVSARPDEYGLFDAHRIAENYITSNFGIGEATDEIDCPESYDDIEIKIGEEYGATPTEHLNLDSYAGLMVNTCLKHSVASFGGEPAFIDTDLRTDYLMSNIVTGNSMPFLTSPPRELTIRVDEFLNNTPVPPTIKPFIP